MIQTIIRLGWECLKQGKKACFKTEKKNFFILKLLKISIVWESNRCDRGMSRRPVLCRLDLYNAAPDHLNNFEAKRRDDYLTPVFLAAYLLDIGMRAESY